MSKNRYEYIVRMEDDLSEQITNLKKVSGMINNQLKQQQKSRKGLQQYIDAGIDGLRKTNQILNELLGTRSLFGCNLCILLGIALVVIIVLILI